MHEFLESFRQEASRALVGRNRELELALCCFLSGGNLLVEDVPGVGKTTMVKVLARLLGLELKRVQFTNDLLPGDILGSHVFDAVRSTFTFHPGPIFAQIVLGDELNRASPRTQSAALQAMDEHEVTIEGQTYHLPEPFFFVGTQNPRDQAGTAALPESQLDRFLMRIELGLPGRKIQRELLERSRGRRDPLVFDVNGLPALSAPSDLLHWQKDSGSVHIAEPVAEYLLDLFEAAARRGWELSPRAALGLQRAAQARAYLEDRPHVRPDDVQALFPSVAIHRLARFAPSPGDMREAANMAREIVEDVRPP